MISPSEGAELKAMILRPEDEMLLQDEATGLRTVNDHPKAG